MKRLLPLLAACAALLMLGGCVSLSSLPSAFRRTPPRPGRTTLGSKLVVVPTKAIGNYLVVEAKWDRSGPYHFLIDTGSSVTLVTPAFAKRYASKDAPPPNAPRVQVLSADGQTTELSPTTIEQISLGDARFDDVFALLYDCTTLSAHLGVKIDGVLGFPLFREALLTLDYPQARVTLQSTRNTALVPGVAIPLNDASKTPLIALRLGDRSFVALIDSGSDAPLSLNPVGLNPTFAVPPRAGSTVGTLTGDRAQRIGRLTETLGIGDYQFPRPLVDLTDELSSIGGEILKNFSVTFDQEHDRVYFQRDTRAPIVSPPRRSAGLSFTKTPAYWRVASVVPQSPADEAEIRPGDLLTHVNEEPVAKWDLNRYEQLVKTSTELAFRFLSGTREVQKDVRTFDLVP
ncbi:MAG: aspartyl protease family protein [Verrucomicrobia bacterium]|nr:aspartyl protease family protein [Verrucomicrobiota bacterium]